MSEEAKGASVPWPALMAVFVATGGAFLLFSSLNSSRPPPPNRNTARALGYQNVDARLWQDPFQVVYSVEERPSPSEPLFTLFAPPRERSKAAPARDLNDLREQVVRHRLTRVDVLAVMVPAGPYAELAEQRLRIRVAVLEGLGRAGFIPQDGEHVGFLEVAWAWQDLSKPVEGRRIIREAIAAREPPFFRIPYEWCVPDGVRMAGVPAGSAEGNESPQRVLVLWLDENVLSDLPLTRLGEFMRQFRSKVVGEPPAVCNLRFKIIGPRVSTTLRAMLSEVASAATDPASLEELGESLRGVEMYSGSPTAEAELLRRSVMQWDDPKTAACQALSRVFGPAIAPPSGQHASNAPAASQSSQRPFSFYRTTPTDDALCRDLVHELELRDVKIRPKPGWPVAPSATYSGEDVDDVAVVTEWDTFYGRAIPLSFALAAVADEKDSAENLRRREAVISQGRFPNWIHPFVYLRGIDGQAPGEERRKTSETDQKGLAGGDSQRKAGTSTLLGTPNEPPEGTNGSDYLRRLADQLAEMDARLRRAGGRGLRAVGVLGTDVYDKLLILRALRDRLPDVLFFTTDLDARYALRSEWPATHNLIVVAPFGLSLAPGYQANLPPFRDSYGTAVFASTLAAARVIPSPQSLSRLTPRRFEIGRQGAYDLSTDPASAPIDAGSVAEERSRDLPRGPGAEVDTPRYNLMNWLYGSRVAWLWALLGGALAAGLLALRYIARDRVEARRPLLKARSYAAMTVSPVGPAQSASVRIMNSLQVGQVHSPEPYEPGGGQATLVREKEVPEPLGDLDAISAGRPPDIGPASSGGEARPGRRLRVPGAGLSLGELIRSTPESVVVVLMAILSATIVWRISGQQTAQGTPFLWGAGMSLWPTEIFRCFVALLAAFWLCRAMLEIRANDQNIEEAFSLDTTQVREIRWWQLRYWDVAGPKRRAGVAFGATADDSVEVERLWSEYCLRSAGVRRWVRTIIATLLFGTLCFVVLRLLGMPHPPIRGDAARWWDRAFLRSSGILSLLLLLFVLDGAYLNYLFIEHLIAAPTRWPPGMIRKTKLLQGLNDEDLADWMAIRLIAERTKVVGKYIYYPFPLLFLCVVARNSYFANWDWPTGLLLIFTAMFLVAVLGAWLLRRSAEHARQITLERMQARHLQYVAAGSGAAAETMNKLIESVKQEKRGAFSILSQYPTLAAVILPSGSFGVWVLIEQLAKGGGS